MTYDRDADAAYIYLVNEIEPGQIDDEHSIIPHAAGEIASFIIEVGRLGLRRASETTN